MNNTYTTNINDAENLSTVTIVPETGEVIENTETAENTGEPAPAKNTARRLFFEPRSWKPAKDVESTVSSRSFISNPFGEGLIEAYTIGDWNWNWSVIETADMTLEKNTDYEFIFWLNGGENEPANEVCKLEVIFDNDYEDRYTYNLNRDFIRYEKHFKGWYLYRIPFNTGNACYTKLQLIAMRAYTTFIKAEDPESYIGLPAGVPPVGVPQRHNIVFKDGFPANASWSYRALGEKALNNNTHTPKDFKFFGENHFERNERKSRFEDSESMERNIESVLYEFEEGIRDRLNGALTDDVIDEVIHNQDVESIKEQIIQQLKDSLNI